MPYARKFYRRRPRKYTRRPRKSTKSTKKPSKFLKRTIQSMISKNVEDKMAYHSTGDTPIWFNSGVNSSADVLQVVPNIANGTLENQRIGDQIRCKALIIRGHLQLEKNSEFGDVSYKRVGVRLMVVTSKKVKPFPDLQLQAGSALLQKGATSKTFDGTISDLYAPVNKEAYTSHYDKTFYLSQDYVAQQAGSSVSMTWSQDISKGLRFFTIRIPMRGRKLLFDEGTSTLQATNWSCGIMLGYVKLDGSSADVVNARVGLSYDATLTYEDA